jgi:hypothetical protein
MSCCWVATSTPDIPYTDTGEHHVSADADPYTYARGSIGSIAAVRCKRLCASSSSMRVETRTSVRDNETTQLFDTGQHYEGVKLQGQETAALHIHHVAGEPECYNREHQTKVQGTEKTEAHQNTTQDHPRRHNKSTTQQHNTTKQP